LALGGCGTLGTFQKVATATVPASVVIPASNGFTILKNAAVNYGTYCIQQKMAPAICEAGTRRIVIKAVRVGTGAQDRMIATIENGTPAAASVFNLMVGAIEDLKNSPAASSQFTWIPLQ
jgi:hypothetical protein